MTLLTLPARKAAAIAARLAAVEQLRPLLAFHAHQLGGRYILFGSAASGAMRPDSDVDLLLDFPAEDTTRAAWDFAEERCTSLGLPYDIRPVGWCGERFLSHVLPTATILG